MIEWLCTATSESLTEEIACLIVTPILAPLMIWPVGMFAVAILMLIFNPFAYQRRRPRR